MDSTALAGDASTLLEAFALPCAVFMDDGGELIGRNQAFADEFRHQAGIVDRAGFLNAFEAFSGAPHTPLSASAPAATQCHRHEVYAPASGRCYAFTWRGLTLGGYRAVLLSALNLTEVQDSLRRHGKLQEQLLMTSRAMSVAEIVSTLAHELNQPLAAILNYVDAAGHALAGGDTGRPAEAMRLARAQAEHAAAVIARMREFVRTREPVLEPQPLRALAEGVIELLQLEARKHRVRVRLDVDERLPQVLADAVMIEQVLANLVKNAIEAMHATPPGERLATVAARLDAEGRVQIRVRDSGPGIDPEEAQRLFTPLYTTKPRGMGVGLALCRSIVEFHQGSLYLEPGNEKGAVFVFTLMPAEVAGP